jgi:hypothetical protein
MPIGGGPNAANSLFRLADVLRGNAEDQRRHTERMYDIRFRADDMAARSKNRELQNKVALRKLDREEMLNAPTTLGQALQEMKVPDEIKQSWLNAIPQEKLNMPTTKRQVMDAYKDAVAPPKEKEGFTLGAGQVRYDAEGNIVARSPHKPSSATKDTRSAARKDVALLQEVYGISQREAMDMYRSDKDLGQRIRLYTNELDRLANDPGFEYAPEDEKAKKIKELRDAYKITDVMPEKEKAEVKLPEGVSMEDVEFTAEKHGVSVDEVIKRITGK